MLRPDWRGEEERCGLREAVRIFCGQIGACPVSGELVAVLGVTMQIIRERLGFEFALCDSSHLW